MHTTMVPTVKTMKIQAGIQVSRPGELRRQLQLWKSFGRLYLIVFVLVRNIMFRMQGRHPVFAGSDTRPQMLIEQDFESWATTYTYVCLGRIMEENIMKAIKMDHSDEDRFRCYYWIYWNRFGAVQQVQLRGIPKDIYSLINHYTDAKDIWENVKMILEGSELTKDDRESQLYDEFEHFRSESTNIDPLAPSMEHSVQQYPTQSSKSPQSSTEPYPSDNFQMDSGSSSTENLIERRGKLCSRCPWNDTMRNNQDKEQLETKLQEENGVVGMAHSTRMSKAKATSESGLLQGRVATNGQAQESGCSTGMKNSYRCFLPGEHGSQR
ncbi:hypothetical protein Tco_0341115 [Tanacetum coccineum]